MFSMFSYVSLCSCSMWYCKITIIARSKFSCAATRAEQKIATNLFNLFFWIFFLTILSYYLFIFMMMWIVNFNFDFLDSYSKISLNSIKSAYINNPIKHFPFSHQSEKKFFTLNCGFKLFHFRQNFKSVRKNFWELRVNGICNNLKLLQIDRKIRHSSHKYKHNII